MYHIFFYLRSVRISDAVILSRLCAVRAVERRLPVQRGNVTSGRLVYVAHPSRQNRLQGLRHRVPRASQPAFQLDGGLQNPRRRSVARDTRSGEK